jgi:hypothetical protein
MRNHGTELSAVRARNPGPEKGAPRHLVDPFVAPDLLRGDRCAHEARRHRGGFVEAALRCQPARALGHAEAQEHHEHRGRDAGGEHPAPRAHVGGDLQDDQSHHRAEQLTGGLQGERAHEQAGAALARRDLGQVRRADRVVRADADAEQEPEGDERPDRPRQCGAGRERDEHRQVRHEDDAAAEPVGDRPERRRPDDRPDDGCRRHQPHLERGRVELHGDERDGDADDEEVEAVEEDAHGRQQPHADVQPRQRRLVEEHIDRRARRRHAAYLAQLDAGDRHDRVDVP